MTMSQKILAAHAGLEEVKAGQLINAKLDMVLGNDELDRAADELLCVLRALSKRVSLITEEIYP